MKRYKIGQIAHFLDLSSETLRYYEKKGIISAQRDEENGYRYYSAWDINYLLDCTYYRSFDFSVQDVKDIIQTDTLETLIGRCDTQLQNLVMQLNSVRDKLDALCLFQEKLTQIERRLGKFELAESPSVFFMKHRKNNTLLADVSQPDQWSYWNNIKPKLRNTFLFPNRRQDGTLDGDFYWGYSIPADEVTEHDRQHLRGTQYLHSRKSLYTVFKAYGENTFFQEINMQVMEKISERHYKMCDQPVVGNLLARVHDGDQIVRYCEVWIPLK